MVTYQEDDALKLRPELVEVRCGWCQHRYPNRTPGLVAFVLVVVHADDYWKILAVGRSGKATTTALFVRIVRPHKHARESRRNSFFGYDVGAPHSPRKRYLFTSVTVYRLPSPFAEDWIEMMIVEGWRLEIG